MLDPQPLVLASTLLLVLFVVLSAVDGIYLHLVRYRLFARRASYREHLWHTARAVLFAPILWLIFLRPTAGVALWTGIGLLALDQAVELLDVLDERSSRAELGGLSSGEYALHAMLITARAAACGLALASRPADAWSLAAPSVIGAHDAWIELVVRNLVPGTVVAAVAHVWLAWRYRPVRGK